MSAEFRRAVETLSAPGDVREIRALKNGATAAGYFDDADALVREADKLEEQGFTVYLTANPAHPALLARAENKIKRSMRETTSDRDILRRRWLLIDCDPVRPAGVSATDGEKSAAMQRAREVWNYLRGEGWPEALAGDSGNGAHLLCPIDLPNDPGSLQLVRGVLEALSFKFSDGRVGVDTGMHNAARITKLYGTTARKGDSTKDRPHRRSKLVKIPEASAEGERGLVSREQLQAVADTKPEPPKPAKPGTERKGAKAGGGEFDLPAWIAEHGVAVKREGPWPGSPGGHRWILEECAWNGHADNAAFIARLPSGEISAGCHHDSCQGYGWRDLRKHYEPDAYEYSSSGRYERNGYERDSEDGSAAPEKPRGILLSEVQPERVRWAWKPHIAFGKINDLAGNPGLGKSALVIDLAARVSAGNPWPDGSECEAGGVVICSAEDGLADTVRPRLDAAGGDPSKVVALSVIANAEGDERQIAIPHDIPAMVEAIERVGASLFIIDPLMAFFPGDVNSHRDQDVRRAMAPLARMGEYTGAAVLVVRHLNKAQGGEALYRGGGSIGIIGAARTGLLVAKHPEDDGRRVMAPVKNNLAAPAPSLVFALSEADNGAVRVDWKGESILDAAALLSAPTDPEERSVLQEAKDLLRETLSEGPAPASDVKQEARSADISERTLKTAKRELGILANREGEAGKRGGGKWIWELPRIKGVKPEGLRPKSEVGDAGRENSAYASQKQGESLRGQSVEDIKGASDDGLLNQPLPAGVVADQMRRANSGPAKALATFLEKPTDERLKWLVCAVLTARGVDAGGWRRHAGAVREAARDPRNHPLGCGCGDCL